MYDVGQVVFVILAKDGRVYPMQVVEKLTKMTLRGEEIRYVLQAGSDKSSTVMLDEIRGDVYESAERAREALVATAAARINRLISSAIEKSAQWYGVHVSEFPKEDIQTINDLPDLSTPQVTSTVPSSDETQVVMLPDGTVAKVRLPQM